MRTRNLVTLGLSSAHKLQTEYDATLRVIRTINPDGSFALNQFEPLLFAPLTENDTAANLPLFWHSVGPFLRRARSPDPVG
jgi:hypothetical protein